MLFLVKRSFSRSCNRYPPPRSSRLANFRGTSVVRHFDVPAAGLTNATFSNDASNEVVKEALLFVEGDHIDSAKRLHKFSADRVFRIAENTNKFLRSGGRVPWQQDHDKTQKANIGDLDGEIELREITISDLPNPRAKHLVGKIGAFGKLIGRGKAIADIVAGNIKTLSPGIDIAGDIIREISATPTPAIVGLSTFKLGEDRRPPVSWDEAEEESEIAEAEREEYQELCEKFWKIANNIRFSSAEEIGEDPYNAMQIAIDGFVERLQVMLSPEGTESDPVPQQPEQIQGGRYPNMRQKTQQNPQAQQQAAPPQPSANMSRFTMADMANEMATFRRRRKMSAATKQKIARALKGKRRRGGSKAKATAKTAAKSVVAATGGLAAVGAIRGGVRAAKLTKGLNPEARVKAIASGAAREAERQSGVRAARRLIRRKFSGGSRQ